MKNIFSKVVEYIPDFFIFTPIVIWVIAFITGSSWWEARFIDTYWWMLFGCAMYSNNILFEKTKKFL